MGESKKKKASSELTLPRMTTVGLKGKQSVRASFKLSEACIQAINIVATQVGIKHRSLFNYLVEDTESLETIARNISEGNQTPGTGIQKIYTISRESLMTIDNLSQKLNISRDTLIELSIRRLLPIIEKEIENHNKRRGMFELVNNHYKDSRNVLNQIKKNLRFRRPRL